MEEKFLHVTHVSIGQTIYHLQDTKSEDTKIRLGHNNVPSYVLIAQKI